tara:strand:- start:4053 stop:4370 length:318 start_codon:yes stop_codon:yes gene_type:complete
MDRSKQEHVVFVTTLKELEELLDQEKPRYGNYVRGLKDKGEIGILFNPTSYPLPLGYSDAGYFKLTSRSRYSKLPHFTMAELRINNKLEKNSKLKQTTNLMQQDR